jgi:hypothetical protein
MTKTSAFAVEPAADDAEVLAEFLPVSSQIEHFLAGNTNGSALLHALYDDTLDEPVPQRLKDMLPR